MARQDVIVELPVGNSGETAIHNILKQKSPTFLGRGPFACLVAALLLNKPNRF